MVIRIPCAFGGINLFLSVHCHYIKSAHFVLRAVGEESGIFEAALMQQRQKSLRLMDKLHVLFHFSLPKLTLAAEYIHAVDKSLLLLVELRSPKAEHILVLGHEGAPRPASAGAQGNGSRRPAFRPAQ